MKVVITAGPTIEKIDPVRFISNHSSGKQGYYLAETFAEVSCEVVLISGPTNITPPKNVKFESIQTAEELRDKVIENLPCDVFISVAAVCDWKPEFSDKKIKKTEEDYLNITLKKNIDVLKHIANLVNRPKLVVGFAAETNDLIVNAKQKLHTKPCDLIIANAVDENGSIFGSDVSSAFLITKDEEIEYANITKKELSYKIKDMILNLVRDYDTISH